MTIQPHWPFGRTATFEIWGYKAFRRRNEHIRRVSLAFNRFEFRTISNTDSNHLERSSLEVSENLQRLVIDGILCSHLK